MTKKHPAILMGMLSIAIFMAACSPPVRQPYVPPASVEVVKLVIDDSLGNNNGQVNPGETVQIKLQLKNVGKTTMPASKASVFTSQSGIVLRQQALNFPAVAAGEIALSREAFVLSVDNKLSVSSAAFSIEAIVGASYKATFPVEIFIPLFPVTVANILVDDSQGGNGDGRANPGETVDLKFQIINLNLRDEILPPSLAALSSSQAGIRIVNAVATFPRIAPGDTVVSNTAFRVAIANDFVGQSAAFCLKGTFSPDGYEASALLQIFLDVFVCVDECTLTPTTATESMLMIRLSVCNRSQSSNPPPVPGTSPAPLNSVAVRIQGISIVKCLTGTQLPTQPRPVMEPVPVPGNPPVPLNVIFYGTITPNSCGEPLQCLVPNVLPDNQPKVQEFRFTIKTAELSTPSCIWFTAEIWQNATRSATNCSISLPAASQNNPLSFPVYSRI